MHVWYAARFYHRRVQYLCDQADLVNNEPLHPGQRVQFRLGDIHLPETAEVIARMTEDTELQGSITLLSDQGQQRAAFAVIEVKGILMPLIVPTENIRVLSASEPAGAAAQRPAPRQVKLSAESGR